MPDVRIPEEIISWMRMAEWGAHHIQWHFERQWDYWHFRAQSGEATAQEVVAYAEAMGWGRASIQEGEAGNGVEFLAMHRAMTILLLQHFPRHLHVFRGWHSVPTDPADADDPVPSGTSFDGDRAFGAKRIELEPMSFGGDDDFGLFIETNLRPLPGNPLNRSPDKQTGIHNYLHGRWTDSSSDINLGDPSVNIFNYRFWKLHGWIDHQWWRFRRVSGASDADPAYGKLIETYLKMMSGAGPHHEHLRTMAAKRATMKTPEAFTRFFDEPRHR
jgi:hypothetical protein